MRALSFWARSYLIIQLKLFTNMPLMLYCYYTQYDLVLITSICQARVKNNTLPNQFCKRMLYKTNHHLRFTSAMDNNTNFPTVLLTILLQHNTHFKNFNDPLHQRTLACRSFSAKHSRERYIFQWKEVNDVGCFGEFLLDSMIIDFIISLWSSWNFLIEHLWGWKKDRMSLYSLVFFELLLSRTFLRLNI